MTQPLPTADPASLGLDPAPLGRCAELISRHIGEGRHPGAQLAVARNGALALFQTFGDARLDPARAPARDDTLWLLYSNTKVITACAVWVLAEHGALRFSDRVADHVPGFEAHGKGEISIVQLLTHQGAFRTRTCLARRGTITTCCGGPSAASRWSGRRARACTITPGPPTGRPRCSSRPSRGRTTAPSSAST